MPNSDTNNGEKLAKPSKSRIKKIQDAQGHGWIVPPTKRINFLWIFSALWLSFISFFTSSIFFNNPSWEKVAELWLFGLFLVPFWLVGIGIAFAALFQSYGSLAIRIRQGNISVERSLFGKKRSKSLPLHQIKKLVQEVAYSQNNIPVYRICMKAKGNDRKKDLTFGAGLKQAEKDWLQQEIAAACHIESEPQAMQGVTITNKKNIQGNLSTLESFKDGGLLLERMSGNGFRVKWSYRSSVWLILGSFLLIVISCFLFFEALNFNFTKENSPQWENIISLLFSLIPALIGTVMSIVALVLLILGIKHWRFEEVFEFDPQGLKHLKGKKGRKKQVTHYSIDAFEAIEKKVSGHVNNDPRYRVSLMFSTSYIKTTENKTDKLTKKKKVLNICSYVKNDTAKMLENWLKSWLAEQSK